jgi:enoyl-CoA hydratase
MSSAGELVHLKVADQVATITLDSPSNRNALSSRLVAELQDHLQTAARTGDVRAVVLTHTGTTFCAGADLAEAVEVGMERGTRALLDLLRTVVELPTPVVAVVRGAARAGGVGLVGACDFALVGDSATFAFTEARLGLAPAIISLTTRSRLADRDAARKFLTGVIFDGREAARSGLVTASLPDRGLDEALAALVQELRAVPRQGLAETKRLLNAPVLAAISTEGQGLVELSARLFRSDIAKEAMTDFRERRDRSG